MMMPPATNLLPQRVIACHFDNYSTALLFVRWPHGGLLAPAALPASASVLAEPDQPLRQPLTAAQGVEIVKTLNVPADTLQYQHDFTAWVATDDGPLRIHLCRYMTPDAPKSEIALFGGEFRHMSALRSADRQELLLLRQVFDWFMRGEGQ